MHELYKLRDQVDAIEHGTSEDSIGFGGGDASMTMEERRMLELESRFQGLEEMVGRERSESAQLWQLVEASAAGTAASDSRVKPVGHGAPGAG